MKKILLTIALTLASFTSFAQNDTISLSGQEGILAQSAKEYLINYVQNLLPRFKLYRTENIYNLIKLDTATGALWQVQYSTGENTDAMTVEIDDSSLLWSFEEEVPGRFELYPTQNMYNFILLDTKEGWTYQVQWNIDPEYRFRMRIF